MIEHTLAHLRWTSYKVEDRCPTVEFLCPNKRGEKKEEEDEKTGSPRCPTSVGKFHLWNSCVAVAKVEYTVAAIVAIAAIAIAMAIAAIAVAIATAAVVVLYEDLL